MNPPITTARVVLDGDESDGDDPLRLSHLDPPPNPAAFDDPVYLRAQLHIARDSLARARRELRARDTDTAHLRAALADARHESAAHAARATRAVADLVAFSAHLRDAVVPRMHTLRGDLAAARAALVDRADRVAALESDLAETRARLARAAQGQLEAEAAFRRMHDAALASSRRLAEVDAAEVRRRAAGAEKGVQCVLVDADAADKWRDVAESLAIDNAAVAGERDALRQEYAALAGERDLLAAQVARFRAQRVLLRNSSSSSALG
ncbi:hypothetical protein H9P43_002287 [Blastocladiella emersonii ATCC 22665]|nr:hypothetical protein H9P43_002287 [Blastocladiella emersonii ATCC 22665]